MRISDWSSDVCSSDLGFSDLPSEVDEEMLADDGFIAAVHRIIMDVHVIEGALICPDTGRRFPIENGIPNMMYVCAVCACIVAVCKGMCFCSPALKLMVL